MNLYEINRDLQNKLMSSVDSDGVIIDGFEAELDELFSKKEEKLLNCAKYLKNETAFAKMLKEEEQSLSSRRKQVENRIKWMKQYIESNMEVGEKYQDNQAVISVRKSQSVEITNETLIPKELCNHIPECWKVDKSAVKSAIKAGNEIEGAKLVENINLQVK